MGFVCFVRISEQTVNFALQNIKRLDFITEVESVHYAVRTESLYNTRFVFKRLTREGRKPFQNIGRTEMVLCLAHDTVGYVLKYPFGFVNYTL
jgi:hypothetical protein